MDTSTPDKRKTAQPRYGGHRLERDELPLRTPGKKDKPLRYVDLWRADRDEKARSVVALSRVPRLAGFAGSLRLPVFLLTSDRPLVRIPANRHTTTGTCEIGQGATYGFRPPTQVFFVSRQSFLFVPAALLPKTGALPRKRRLQLCKKSFTSQFAPSRRSSQADPCRDICRTPSRI